MVRAGISRRLSVILFTLLCSLSTALWGQSADEQPDSKQTQDTSQSEQPKTKEKNSDVISDSTFTPTEEISEDLSVSFPTDI